MCWHSYKILTLTYSQWISLISVEKKQLTLYHCESEVYLAKIVDNISFNSAFSWGYVKTHCLFSNINSDILIKHSAVFDHSYRECFWYCLKKQQNKIIKQKLNRFMRQKVLRVKEVRFSNPESCCLFSCLPVLKLFGNQFRLFSSMRMKSKICDYPIHPF